MIPKRGGKSRRLASRPCATGWWSRPRDGARADPRGGLQAVQLRLPPRTPGAGRDRRDPLLHLPLIRVDRGGDIKACFDEISHVGVQDRLRPESQTSASCSWSRRSSSRDSRREASSVTRSPARPKRDSRRCSVTWRSRSSTSTSPRLESFATDWLADRAEQGLANYRLVRYATTGGTRAGDRAHAEALRDEARSPLHDGLRLSLEKTRSRTSTRLRLPRRRIQRHTELPQAPARLHLPLESRLASIKTRCALAHNGPQRTSPWPTCALASTPHCGMTTHFRHDVSKHLQSPERLPLERTVRWLRKNTPMPVEEAPQLYLPNVPQARDPVQPQLVPSPATIPSIPAQQMAKTPIRRLNARGSRMLGNGTSGSRAAGETAAREAATRPAHSHAFLPSSKTPIPCGLRGTRSATSCSASSRITSTSPVFTGSF